MHWIVPRSINPAFTGRRDILDKLRQQLCETEIEEQRRIVIWGIGGSGKSEVCLKFGDENRENFWVIFWVDATSKESVRRGIAHAASKVCDSKMSYEDAKLWFSNLETPWLLIFDNADSPTVDYSEFFPPGRKGCILFTTRNEQCNIYGTVGSYEVGKLAVDDAITLLLKSCGCEETLWSERSEDARMLVGDNVLAQHALPIIQAGAFIKQGFCKLEEYLPMFEKERQRLLTHRPPKAKSIYGDVYATFEVSANAIRSSSDLACKDALKLLEVLAFLYHEGVPEEMFIRAWNYSLRITRWDEKYIPWPSLWHVNNIKALHGVTFLQEFDIHAFRQAQQVLISFSLVNYENNHLFMHPLIHKWAKDRLDYDFQIAAWGITASLLTLSTAHLYNSTIEFDYYNTIQTHLEFCLSSQPSDIFAIDQYPPLDICRIFYRFTYVLYYMGNLEMAEEVGSRLLSRIGHEISEQSWNWRYTKSLVARCQRELGKHEEALQALKEVVLFDEKTDVDPENENRLRAQYELARTHQDLRQYRVAINILEEVVKIREGILPSTDSDLLAAQDELARAFLKTGRTKKALQLLEEVVRVRQKILSPTHPDLLSSQRQLARVLKRENK